MGVDVNVDMTLSEFGFDVGVNVDVRWCDISYDMFWLYMYMVLLMFGYGCGCGYRMLFHG